ncbi:winged helix-turn-helix domain-containing protein [Dyadobacter psychrotolerans]|uniref:Winged helix family transcriptional regulator n=1 Tax=Dyadobacter psychrotolerans TaxID=2541721 RepID=A0A4R5DVM6_9BACT|nr:winged helix-turn-helix domain-containing protein [Dyadobacter psychrotolerans]TDE18509.1 winged helix family transcriptional regulator [Dyadobacter psychrotolerans]
MARSSDFCFKAATRATLTLVVAVIFLFFQTATAIANNESGQFSEKANLVLRRTAHGLLIANGDSVSVIPPVEQTDNNTFTIKLNQSFDYGKLPQLLNESLDLYQITRGYNVTIVNCTTGHLQLGYNFKDMSAKGGVPCLNREQLPGCYNLKLSFYPPTQQATAGNNWWLLPIGSLAAGLGYLVWRKSGKSDNSFLPEVSEVNTTQKKHFANSVLDITNLTLVCRNENHKLTYREAKLLNLFAENKNQVLERDFILKSVWEDEGIIVGRSVDVFVSRLRKMLQNDSLVKISAVHGVGYRMEVAE